MGAGGTRGLIASPPEHLAQHNRGARKEVGLQTFVLRSQIGPVFSSINATVDLGLPAGLIMIS